MASARFNLVRTDSLVTTEGLDLESGATVWTQADEVELVTPDGDPAAMPMQPSWIDQDIRYQYVGGGIGLAPRRRRHQIALAVDYLGDYEHGRLEQWMHDRATVWFNPGFGRYTDLAYRPLTGAGGYAPDGTTLHYDLTGRNVLATAGDATFNHVWDPWRQVYLGEYAGTAPRRVIATPAGAGICCERTRVNRHSPASPQSANEGNGSGDSGWNKIGSESADITFSYASNGFGHDDFPGALHVTTTYAASRLRAIDTRYEWDSGHAEYNGYSWTGSSRATVSIWLKGRFGYGTFLSFGGSGSTTDTITLRNYDTSEWTKFSLSTVSADWSSGDPYVQISMNTTDAGSDDFYVGPLVVEHNSTSIGQQAPEYGTFGTSVTNSHLYATYTPPAAGSVVSSFWWPEDADAYIHYLFGTDSAIGRLGLAATSARFYRTASDILSGTITPLTGAINTIAAVWGNGTIALYYNGSLVDSAAASEREITMSSATTAYLGQAGGYAAWPLIPLTWRIDRRVWTEAEMAQLDASLRDPVANQLSVQARGRKYRIAAIPSTARNQQGGTAWIGNLVLEEHEYDENFADITSAEDW